WSKSGEEAVEDYRKGQTVTVKVLDVDVEKERIALGIKQLEADPFEQGMAKLKKGDVVTATISQVTDGGIEVTLADGVPVGERVDAKVTQIDRATRKVTLSIKAREVDEEKRAMAEFGSSDSGASLGDILGAAIRRRQEGEEEKG